MFCLYAGKLNEDLCERAESLKDKIIMFKIEENRELNKRWEMMFGFWMCFVYTNVKMLTNQLLFFARICQKYEAITELVRGTPGTTEELVTLTQYIKNTSEVTVPKLIDELDDAMYRLSFLLDYAALPSMKNQIIK